MQKSTNPGWTNELDKLNNCSNAKSMIDAIFAISRYGASSGIPRQEFEHDVALVMCEMYMREHKRANAIGRKAIKEKYNLVANTVFKCPFGALYQHIMKTEPNFNPSKVNLGFVKADALVKDGKLNAPLGFVGTPLPRKGEDGNLYKGLGFLDCD